MLQCLVPTPNSKCLRAWRYVSWICRALHGYCQIRRMPKCASIPKLKVRSIVLLRLGCDLCSPFLPVRPWPVAPPVFLLPAGEPDDLDFGPAWKVALKFHVGCSDCFLIDLAPCARPEKYCSHFLPVLGIAYRIGRLAQIMLFRASPTDYSSHSPIPKN